MEALFRERWKADYWAKERCGSLASHGKPCLVILVLAVINLSNQDDRTSLCVRLGGFAVSEPLGLFGLWGLAAYQTPGPGASPV